MPRRRRPDPGSRPKPLPWEEVYPTLDLHGRTGDEAREAADRWLRKQQGAGERTVRLITGWGRHSQGPPVLRAEIQALLDELRGRIVERVHLESGGGAFRVELLRPRDPRPRPRATPPRRSLSADPALRRAAEDSLADLGVEPTPELLEAEMRRLRGEGVE